MSAAFPDIALDVRAQILMAEGWVDMGPLGTVGEDYFTDVFTDVWLGRLGIDVRRLPNQAIPLTYGRADEFSQSEPAELSVIFWNEDGQLTPLDPRSQWWPEWDVGRPFRLLVDGEIEFYGEVSSIVPEWPHGDLSHLTAEELYDLADASVDDVGYSHVVVTASGELRRLGQGQPVLRSSLYRAIVAEPTLVEHWSLEDGTDADAAVSSTGGNAMQLAGMQMSSSTVVLGADPLPEVSGGGMASWLGRVTDMPAGDWIYEQTISIPTAPSAADQLVRVFDLTMADSAIVRWRVDVSFNGTDPTIRLVGSNAVGIAVVNVTTLTSVLYGVPGLLRFRRNGTAYSLTFNRLEGAITLASGTYSADPGRIRSVRGQIINCPPGGVSFGHPTIHRNPDLGWVDEPFRGWLGETDGDRAVRLCAEEDVALTVVGDPSDCSRMGPQKSATLLELLQECASTGLAILGENRRGPGLRYLCRRARFNRPVALTLDAHQHLAVPFSMPRDDQAIRNDVTAESETAGSVRRFDPVDVLPSPTGRGRYEETYQLSLSERRSLRHHAGWRLHMGTWKGPRYPEVNIDFGVCPELRGAVFALHEGDRIQITNLPPQHLIWPAPVDLIFEGISWTISGKSLVATLNCSPAGPWTVARWGISKYGFKDKTLAAPVDADDTTLTVQFPGKRIVRSSVSPDEFPIEAILGGCEVVLITACTGDTSPQTLTVTRNLNSLGRAHPAGATLELAQRPVLAL